MNAGRSWRGKYCFANRGEQIVGGSPKTITFLNIPEFSKIREEITLVIERNHSDSWSISSINLMQVISKMLVFLRSSNDFNKTALLYPPFFPINCPSFIEEGTEAEHTVTLSCARPVRLSPLLSSTSMNKSGGKCSHGYFNSCVSGILR